MQPILVICIGQVFISAYLINLPFTRILSIFNSFMNGLIRAMERDSDWLELVEKAFSLVESSVDSVFCHQVASNLGLGPNYLRKGKWQNKLTSSADAIPISKSECTADFLLCYLSLR